MVPWKWHVDEIHGVLYKGGGKGAQTPFIEYSGGHSYTRKPAMIARKKLIGRKEDLSIQ